VSCTISKAAHWVLIIMGFTTFLCIQRATTTASLKDLFYIKDNIKGNKRRRWE